MKINVQHIPAWFTISLLAVFIFPVLGPIGEVYAYHEEFAHGYLIPLISVYMAWVILKKAPQRLCPSPLPGLALISLGIALMLLAFWYMTALLPNASLGTGTLIGIGIIMNILGFTMIMGGSPLVRTLWFPIAYLGFAIPLPSLLSQGLTLRLRDLVSFLSEQLLQLLNVPVFREGNLFTLENTVIGVADACSGIRSLGILIATAAALAFLFKTDLIRGILLGCLAVGFAIWGNLLRVTAIALLVIHVGPEWADGARHEVLGMVAFGVSWSLLIGTGFWLSNSQKMTIGEETSAIPIRNSESPGIWVWGIASLLITIGIAGKWAIDDHYARLNPKALASPSESFTPLQLFPEKIGPFFQIRHEMLPESHMEILRPTDSTIRVFEGSDGYRIRFWIFRFSPGSFSPGIHQPDSCYPAVGWDCISEKEIPAATLGLHQGRIHLRLFEKEQIRRAVLFWFGTDTIPQLPPKGIFPKIDSLIQSWWMIPEPSPTNFILTMETDAVPNLETAHKRLFRFARTIAPLLREYGLSIQQSPI